MSSNGKALLGKTLEQRRKDTAERIDGLRGKLSVASDLCGARACVYMTGSFGRGEASSHSDLDLFIASHGSRKEPCLRNLEEILVKAELIQAIRDCGIQDFSGDGQYLNHYTTAELVETLGKPEDDFTNTFTARLLLLLESSPLLGASAYHNIIDDVITAYWRDFEDHKNDFMPAFLANDILRMWRTFCVNYEARTQTEPAERKAKRKLKNYKLKHSRLLTCYSALLFLLAVFMKKKTVSPTDASEMIQLTPTGRLDWILSDASLSRAHENTKALLACYEDFLSNTDASESDLVNRFLSKEQSRKYFESANRFGDLMFAAMDDIGQKSAFYRLLVV